jgi:hypothetical protein
MAKKSNYQVKDNFLDKESFYLIKNTLELENFNWFYRENMSKKNNDMCYFTHSFYNDNNIQSNFYDVLKPLLHKLKAISLIAIRANMTINKENSYESPWHVDYPYKNSKTAILYLTTCNAKTIIDIEKKKIEINSVENRVLIFDTNILHKFVSATNTKKRIVINLNYFNE